MGKVKNPVKISKAAFAVIDKDPDTLYFVSDNGDFDPLSLTNDEEGDIYLGDTLLTRKTVDSRYFPGENVSISQLVPDGYTPVEYVSNANNATKVITGIYADKDSIEIGIRFSEVSGANYLFQARKSSSKVTGFAGSSEGAKISLASNYSANPLLLSNISRVGGKIYDAIGTMNNGLMTLKVSDGTSIDVVKSEYTFGAVNAMFCLFGNANYCAAGARVYGAYMNIGGVCVMNYIPVKYHDDNNDVDVYGFWDTVSRTFKGATMGELTGGNSIDRSNDYVVSAKDTTYESLPASNGGTDLSLVMTGDKYIWDNKSDFSGDYNDLDNTPEIPAAQVNSDWNATSGPAEILNKPMFFKTVAFNPSGAVEEGWRPLCTISNYAQLMLLTSGVYSGSPKTTAIVSIGVNYTNAGMRLLSCSRLGGLLQLRLVRGTSYKWRLEYYHSAYTGTGRIGELKFTVFGMVQGTSDWAEDFSLLPVEQQETPANAVLLDYYVTSPSGVVNNEIQAGLGDSTTDVTDNTDIVTSHINGYSSTNKGLYRRKATCLWNYIKSKIASILGLSSTIDGIPLAPTAAAGTNTTQVATTAFVKSAVDGSAYTHPSYTALTGKPTANQTPGFGSTFPVSQVKTDATGHVTALTERTVKIPENTATVSEKGLMSAADKAKLEGLFSTSFYICRQELTTTNNNIEIRDPGLTIGLGSMMAIRFLSRVPASATIEVNSTGAKPIILRGETLPSGAIYEDDTALFVYDLQYWYLLSVSRGFDRVPTDNSVNLLTSGAIYSSIRLKQDRLIQGTGIVISDNNTISADTSLSTSIHNGQTHPQKPVFARALCAVDIEGYMRSFTTNRGIGQKTADTSAKFPIGCKLYRAAQEIPANSLYSQARFDSSCKDLDLRYSGNVVQSYDPTYYDVPLPVYLEVSINKTNGNTPASWSPSNKNYIIAFGWDDDNLKAYNYYILIGYANMTGELWYMSSLEEANPLYYYDGTNMIDWATKIAEDTVPPPPSQSNWDETDDTSDSYIQNKPCEEVNVQTASGVTADLVKGKIYHFTSNSLTSLTLTLKESENTNRLSHYHFDFTTSGASLLQLAIAVDNNAYAIRYPAGFLNPLPKNTQYEVDILDGYVIINSWDLTN